MLPKQYLDLAGMSLLERSVRALLRAPWVAEALVVAAPGDFRAEALLAGVERTRVINLGGPTRRDTVLAGLRFLQQSGKAAEEDWVLVHDAARPGLGLDALTRLKNEVSDDDAGGLLAIPVADTVKREGPEQGTVAATIDRKSLWLAQTPQMFRLGRLALALDRHPAVTDEAAAVEAEGLSVRLIRGELSNFKVTTPDDLGLMRRLLEQKP